jgi:hypothetical protein
LIQAIDILLVHCLDPRRLASDSRNGRAMVRTTGAGHLSSAALETRRESSSWFLIYWNRC